MSGHILIIEPDVAGRAMMDRVLAAEGHAVDAVASLADARRLLASGIQVALAIVDELGARAAVLEDVRSIRRDYPSIPVIVMGALLSSRVMAQLLRLRVADALEKPFTPDQLREAVARALEGNSARHDEALEFAAALDVARRAIVDGRVSEAAPALRRAQAASPLDAEVMALWALVAELTGVDDDADRGYRAALSLRHEEDTPPPDPHEGLARLAAYGPARPTAALRPDRAGAALWVVAEPADELSGPSPAGAGPCVVLLALGLRCDRPGKLFYRDDAGPRAFALMPGSMSIELLPTVLQRLGERPIVATERTRARLDLDRLMAAQGFFGSKAQDDR